MISHQHYSQITALLSRPSQNMSSPKVKAKPLVIIVMGVSGSGKTTVGKMLADEIGWQFKDADDFHSQANKEKMHQGIALTDEDRLPWLESLGQNCADWMQHGVKTVLACSALKISYRSILTRGSEQVAVVYLRADYQAIAARLEARSDHFMNKDLLQSQFTVLEEPRQQTEAGETLIVDGTNTPDQIVEFIREQLDLG
jgi:gluconokinase